VKLITIDLYICCVIGVVLIGVGTHPAVIAQLILLGVLGVADAVVIIGVMLGLALDVDHIIEMAVRAVHVTHNLVIRQIVLVIVIAVNLDRVTISDVVTVTPATCRPYIVIVATLPADISFLVIANPIPIATIEPVPAVLASVIVLVLL
jgi:hypothetical protein